MKYESILLDVDGTLWDSRALVARGWNQEIAASGKSKRVATTQNITPLFGKTITEIADRFFPELPAQERYALMEACLAREHQILQEDPCRIFYPGVLEALPRLAEEHRLFIVSNCQRGYIELLLEKSGLGPYITDHLCFGDTGKSKGENLRLLLERHGVTSGVYVGDTQMDLQAAQAAGLPFLWASYGFGRPAYFDSRLDCFADLAGLVS